MQLPLHKPKHPLHKSSICRICSLCRFCRSTYVKEEVGGPKGNAIYHHNPALQIALGEVLLALQIGPALTPPGLVPLYPMRKLAVPYSGGSKVNRPLLAPLCKFQCHSLCKRALAGTLSARYHYYLSHSFSRLLSTQMRAPAQFLLQSAKRTPRLAQAPPQPLPLQAQAHQGLQWE